MKKSICNTRGTVLIFSLLVVLVGAVVLAGWATMLATRSLFPDSATVAQKNRIAMANGRAIAREHVLRNITNTTFPAANYALMINDAAYSDGFTNWGGLATAAANYADNIFSNADIRNIYNPFSPGERDGFEILISGSVTTSVETNPWAFRIRGRSPIYGGNPLVIQSPRSTIPAGIAVFTNTLMWTNSTSTTPLPFTPIGSKNAAAAAYCYSGNISITPNRFGNQFLDGNSTTGIENDSGNHTVTINLNPPQARAGIGYYLIDNATTTLILRGETYSGNSTSSLPAFHIIYDYPGDNRNLTITLDNENKCRTYLSVIQGNATAPGNATVTMTTSNATANPFRIGILRQGGGTLTINNNPRLKGGIRTDADLSAAGLRLEAENYEAGLESFADRIIWLEDNQQ